PFAGGVRQQARIPAHRIQTDRALSRTRGRGRRVLLVLHLDPKERNEPRPQRRSDRRPPHRSSSSTVSTRSTETFSSTWSWPEGQRTTRRTSRSTDPRPKWASAGT